MRASGIEVTKKSGIPVIAILPLLLQVIALGFDMIAYASFGCGFSLAIRVGWPDRAMLRNWDHVRKSSRVAINGRGGGKYDISDIVRGHRGEEIDSAVHIGAIVFKRNLP